MPDLSHFDRLAPHVQQIAHAVYDLVADVDPDLSRMKRWGFPGFVGNSTIATVCGQPNHVNLQFFYGAHLPNTNDLLEGTGKDLRHIKFRSLEEVRRLGIKDIIIAAIEHDAQLPDEGLRARAENA
jgi:hypothetical protein